VQVAALKNLPAAQPSWHCTVALAFGRTPDEALRDARASMTKDSPRLGASMNPVGTDTLSATSVGANIKINST